MPESIEKRTANLIAKMTLEEKISQMVYQAPAVERLGIPEYNWWNEGLHGLGRAGLATVFPQAIGLAATWNPELVFQVATATSDEARAKHHAAARRGMRQIYTGLTFWSPNINIFRDPRWGRGQETYGEDPFLTAALGVAFIRGLQGDNPEYLKLVATPKHFAVHSGPESERHRFDAQVNTRDLRETYLPAFEACVKVGGAASVMGAYNRTNGEPCCASPTLLEKILRQEWGFEGYVVSDCGAILDIYAHHEVVETPAQAAALAVRNGCDLNCGETYSALLEAAEEGLITEAEIDRAVQRLFLARMRLGMFEPEERVPYAQIPYEVVDTPNHRELALRAAQESVVLLKNEAGLLPLSKDMRSIAVIGPNADDLQALLGNYNGTPAAPVTPLQGIRGKLSPQTRLFYARGCDLAPGAPPWQVISPDYLRPLEASTGQRGLSAAYYAGPTFAGEPAFRRIDACVDFTWKDTSPVTGAWGERFAIRWMGYLVPPSSGSYRLGVSGLNEYQLRLDGKLIVSYSDIHHPVLKSQEINLEAGRFYEIRLDYINRGLDPQVRLLWSQPESDDLAQALEVARKADVVIAVMGLSPMLEGEEMPVQVDGFSGGDRTDIGLPKSQLELLQQVHSLGKPIILVLMNGGALAIPWAAQHIPAILEAWYPGQAGGQAIADVLFGDYNPGGKLPVTVYRSIEDLPPFEDYAMAGRTYRYFQGRPIFAFGHGLSYTTFDFENLQVEPAQIQAGEEVNLQLEVVNTGERIGDEVVQLYVCQRSLPPPAPLLELKRFQRISLAPGERCKVEFHLPTQEISYYDENQGWLIHPGIVDVMVGPASDNLELRSQFEIL